MAFEMREAQLRLLQEDCSFTEGEVIDAVQREIQRLCVRIVRSLRVFLG